MKKHSQLCRMLAVVLMVSVMVMTGCSGSGSGGGTPGVVSTQGVSKGVITAVQNNTVVNGVSFDTSGATISMEDSDDLPILKVGMVVTVKGAFSDSSHGKASSITFADNLKGPIAAFDNSAGTMTVLGQKVNFSSSTVFDDFPTKGTSSVALGQMVQVSGFVDPGGVIKASRIERHLPDWTQSSVVELKGTISTMPTASTFTIGGLTVDTSGIQMPAGIVIGSFVKVQGKLAQYTGTILKATSVWTYREGVEGNASENNRVEVDGFVKNLSGNTFIVGGTLVNAGTLSLAGIANGVEVEVKGYYSNGVLMANKIEVEGSVPPATVPAAPAVSAVGGVSLTTVSWNGVNGASSYNIYWSSISGVTPATGTKIANAVSPYVHTGLIASTTYYYVVTAVNAAGESAPSAQVSATTITAQSVPGAPIGVSAVGGANQATISWAAVAGATSYNVYRSLTAAGATTLFSNATSPFVQTGLTAATTYYYVVTAVNAAGESAQSTQVSASTSSPAVLPAPTGTAAVAGDGQVSISWNAVTGATSYNLYWSTTTGVTPLTGTLISNATSPYVQTGLAASTTYYYIVTAVGVAGESAPSSQASGTTTAAPMAPAAPTAVTAIGGNNLVTISWPVVNGATSYNLYWSTTTGVTPANGALISNVTSPFIHTGRSASTTYFYVVTAVNNVGPSAPSLQVSATTTAPVLVCGTCHAIPPALGAHLFHTFTSCATCHGPGYSNTTVNAALHMNGARDVVISIWSPTTRSCTASCHGARAW